MSTVASQNRPAPVAGTDGGEALVRQRCEQLLAEHPPASTPIERFLGAQFDLGLAWVTFPLGLGGLGLPAAMQAVVDQRLAQERAPSSAGRNPIGHGMAAPTLLVHGSAQQQRRYLRPLFTGEEVWCQLFSEPGAGSDVAALATRARRDGDEWVVNGQKVWTTLAHVSRWGLLAARTDPEVPKHEGLSYFVLDMQAPGVEVRPLFQLTGEAEFNEVYLTDARIPDGERLGEVGEGWRVVLTTLMNERVAIGGSTPARGGGYIAEVLRLWADAHQTAVARDALAQLWIRAEVLRLTNIRAGQLRAQGTPGPEGAIGKALSASLNQDLTDFAVRTLGADGLLKPGGYPMIRSGAKAWYEPVDAFLRTRANSIEGGTTEIAKNILGERVLGLPGEPRVDKHLPWSQVPRS